MEVLYTVFYSISTLKNNTLPNEIRQYKNPLSFHFIFFLLGIDDTFTGIQAADAFANFFSSVLSSDMPQLDIGQKADFESMNNSNYINIINVNQREVLYAIDKLKVDSFIGLDGIPSPAVRSIIFLTCPYKPVSIQHNGNALD